MINTVTKTKYHTVGTVPKSDEQIQTPCTNIHHRSFSWIDTGTSIKGGGVYLWVFK
jgi:hypothetical protein